MTYPSPRLIGQRNPHGEIDFIGESHGYYHGNIMVMEILPMDITMIPWRLPKKTVLVSLFLLSNPTKSPSR